MVEEKDIEPHVPVWDKNRTQERQLLQQRFSLE